MPSAPPWNRRSLRPESATGARMQPAAATNPAQIRLRCPRCGTGIPDSQCPACRFVVTVGRGIVRALSPESQAHLTGFMDEYERSEEHTSELQSLMRISYAVFCLKQKKQQKTQHYASNK